MLELVALIVHLRGILKYIKKIEVIFNTLNDFMENVVSHRDLFNLLLLCSLSSLSLNFYWIENNVNLRQD